MELTVWGTVKTAELDEATSTYFLKEKQLKTTAFHGFFALLFMGLSWFLQMFLGACHPGIAFH